MCLPVPLPPVKLLKRCQEEQEEEREACECQGFSPILSSSFLKRASHSLQSVLERLPKNLVSPLFIFWCAFGHQSNGGFLFVCLFWFYSCTSEKIAAGGFCAGNHARYIRPKVEATSESLSHSFKIRIL